MYHRMRRPAWVGLQFREKHKFVEQHKIRTADKRMILGVRLGKGRAIHRGQSFVTRATVGR
jgi:hypothetical protein